MKAYKTQIYLNPKQVQLIEQTFGNCRYLYNSFISYNINLYEKEKKFISGYDFSKKINNDPETPEWLKLSPSKANKQSIMNAEKAFKKFFNKKGGFPNFKSKNNDKQSFYLIGTFHIERHRIFLPVLKWVKLSEYGYIPTDKKIKSVTVSRRNGRYYVSCLVEEISPEYFNEFTEGIGIDVGIRKTAVVEDEIFININNTDRVRKLVYKLKKFQKKLSKLQLFHKQQKRKLYECRNYQKLRRKISRLHERLERIRFDYINKITKYIIDRKPRSITIEDLNIKGMMKNRSFARSLAEQKIGYFFKKLEEKCLFHGIELRKIDRFFPSSKLCSACGFKNPELKLQEIWTCPNCSVTHDRDKNASLNIKQAQNFKILCPSVMTLKPTAGTAGSKACGSSSIEVVDLSTKRDGRKQEGYSLNNFKMRIVPINGHV